MVQDNNRATDLSVFHIYNGNGQQKPVESLPKVEGRAAYDDPSGYVASPGLRDAVSAALWLGQPLVITGDPGTGKTQLAYSVAYEFSLPPPLVFHVKTTTTARDLFYRYDALGHFQAAQLGRLSGTEKADVSDYITFQALGLAIQLASGSSQVGLAHSTATEERVPVRSVVLLDEIDKAPRDLPNDVLDEIDQMAFTVKETGQVFRCDEAYRPILIMTSNSEKNLPDAFLRRCIFHHIEFPDRTRLRQIIQHRLNIPVPRLTQLSREVIDIDADFTEEMLDHALNRFDAIRQMPLKKKPSTAELLNWLRLLQQERLDVTSPQPGQEGDLESSYSVLLKNKDDRNMLVRQTHKES